MIIRKMFRPFAGAHVVRKCTSNRCSHSIHGHNYTVEVFITSDKLDNGQMLVDFGLFKGPIKDIVDSFDHAYSMWKAEDEEFKTFIKKTSERWIEMPVSPSAEMYSLMFFYIIDRIIKNTTFINGEGNVKLYSVRVHETDSGYAESFEKDICSFWRWNLEDITFSEQIKSEWANHSMWNMLLLKEKFINPKSI